MKRYTEILIVTLLSLFSLAGCKEESAHLSPEGELFLLQTEFGIYKGDLPVVTFPKYESQLTINTQGTLFCLQTNDLSRIVECRLDRSPIGERKVRADVVFEGVKVDPLEDAEFRVVKEEPGKAWLWNHDSGIGILMMTE